MMRNIPKKKPKIDAQKFRFFFIKAEIMLKPNMVPQKKTRERFRVHVSFLKRKLAKMKKNTQPNFCKNGTCHVAVYYKMGFFVSPVIKNFRVTVSI